MKQPGEKMWTREIPPRKNFKPTKLPREKNWTHEGTVAPWDETQDKRWHENHEI